MGDFASEPFLSALNLEPSRPVCIALGPGGEEMFFPAAFGDVPGPRAIFRFRPEAMDAAPVLELGPNEQALCLGLSPTGERIAVVSGIEDDGAGVTGTLRVAEVGALPTWVEKELHLSHPLHIMLDRHAGDPRSQLCWSPDGRWVAYAVGGQVRRARVGTDADLCVTHLKQLALASLMFALDWDEELPGPAHVELLKQTGRASGLVEGPDWWTGLIYPYIRNRDLLQCPLMGEDEGSGYTYPEHLWGKKLGDIPNPSKTILLMDSDPRHDGYRAVAFADGHAKLVAEEDVPKIEGK